MLNRVKKIQEIRAKLSMGLPTIGSWLQIPHPSLAEIMGQSGYDWVTVDMEHGSTGVNNLPDLFRALELGDTLPMARLAHGHLKDCKDALDAGAGGIIIPMIESAKQLTEMVNACRWPPMGTRGVGFSRANLYGKHFDAYMEEAQNPIIVAQIENINAVKDIKSILAVAGLDAIIIGPYDLSASMGLTGQFTNPAFIAELNKVIEACKQFPKAAGVHIVSPDPGELNKRIKEGYQFIAYSMDSVFINHSAKNPLHK